MIEMTSVVSQVYKLSHKQFRAMLKKFRRKKKRQQQAKEREEQELLEQQRRESSPNFAEREEDRRRNSELYEQFEERERMQRNKLWLLREEQAQIEFKKKQERLELEKIRKEEERKRILAEFEKQQFIEAKELEQKEKIKTQKEVKKSERLFKFLVQALEALQEALSKLSEGDGPWHNPIAPENYNNREDREQCMFFLKTGACRFGERCSRGHIYPQISTTILIKGMYSHFSIGQSSRDDYDTDAALEYEEKERYQDFLNFYWDVLPEFKKYGRVVQFKVCCNHEPHLRGNVYVQYTREEDAVEAYKNFNGRFYAGRQLTCEFTHVIRWRGALCGLYYRNQCPKGVECNFLHCFKNPEKEFWFADKDLLPVEVFRHSRSRRTDEDRSENRSDRHNSSRDRHRETSYDYEDDRRSHRDSYSRNSSSYRRNYSEERSSNDVSRENYSRDRYSETISHERRKHKRSRSRSADKYDDEIEKSSKHKKSKHKKKKSKKAKKKRSSSDSESD